MKSVAAAKFKEQCPTVLDRVDPEGIVITKHGKPVAKLIPLRKDPADLIGSLKGKIRIKGDISSTGLAWDAQSRHPRSSARARRQSYGTSDPPPPMRSLPQPASCIRS